MLGVCCESLRVRNDVCGGWGGGGLRGIERYGKIVICESLRVMMDVWVSVGEEGGGGGN